ncbi:MAG: DUF4249 domain-containing protein [Bernardetiaceae bacterium]|jgi:hypothetical protein|nr:DUF4249 domain-containing protein [Bernardetiaceae bacterium]
MQSFNHFALKVCCAACHRATLWLGLALATAGLASCDQEVRNVNLPRIERQLAIYSFISPQDTTLSAWVYETSPLLGPSTRSIMLVPNAMVVLADDTRQLVLPPVRENNAPQPTVYRAAATGLPIVAGRTYRLRVSVPDGRTAEAQCTVPTEAPEFQFRLDTSQFRINANPEGRVVINWQSLSGGTGYYRIAGLFWGEMQIPPNWPFGNGQFSSPVFWNTRSDLFATPTDGGAGRALATEGSFRSNQSFGLGARLLQLDLGLLHVDEPYYRYHQTLGQNINSAGNPFAEPSLVYTNVRGGLGVFGAFNRRRISLRLF